MISTRKGSERGHSAKKGSADPVDALLIKTVDAGDRPPVEFFKKTGWAAPAFLLEGGAGGWFDGRFSLMGGAPFAVFQSKGASMRFEALFDRGRSSFFRKGDPLAVLREMFDQMRPRRGAPPVERGTAPLPFLEGGAVGFFSYDLARQFERIPAPIDDDPSLPDIHLLFLNLYIIFDHPLNRLYLIFNPAPETLLGKDPELVLEEGKKKLEILQKRLEGPDLFDPDPPCAAPPRIQADLPRRRYIQMVRRAKEYIAAGDIFQANLSHRFTAPFHFPSALPLYKRLRTINPSPFSAYLDLGELQIASASPERLVRVENGWIETKPIAGTRPRGKTPSEDEEMVRALYESEKERAEHLMLVDLERNDLGKICRYGSIQVERLMSLEKYSHVLHLVSHIRGELAPGTSLSQVLKAVFPGGTITGVPKIRCMEIISELEGRSRGVYTGAIGYIGFNGALDLNIAIRTLVRREGEITFHVGAGVVADSDPDAEYQETLQKAAALIKALEG